ncbi:MAG: hypothetical protein ACK55Z_02665, partial [bacterium]
KSLRRSSFRLRFKQQRNKVGVFPSLELPATVKTSKLTKIGEESFNKRQTMEFHLTWMTLRKS